MKQWWLIDIVDSLIKDINKAINNSNNLFSKACIRSLKVPNQHAPVLRGLPEIHMPNMPIRPLVNFTSSPAYIFVKKLDRLIRNEIVLKNNMSLKNSTDLIDHISNLKLKDSHRLASFDVVNLYTNVAICKTLAILKDNLVKNSSLTNKFTNWNCFETTLF